jgi:large subunit ribosomal protein L9
MLESLSRMTLSIIMNKDSPWTLQPWHVRASFRKCGYVVPESAIEMHQKSIKGPDMNIEGKEFYITVTVRKFLDQ